MNTDEQLKTIVDTFGSLSFLLETAVKLHQTKDHPEIKAKCFETAQQEAHELLIKLKTFNIQPNE